MAVSASSVDSPSWLTKDGYLDMRTVPLEYTYRQAREGDARAVGNALRVLACAANERSEAALFPLGVFVLLPPEDWALRSEAARALSRVRTPACAGLLLAELSRVKGGNTTRRYLDQILEALSRFPAELVSEQLEALACDPPLQPAHARQLPACRAEAERHSGRPTA